MVKRRKKKLDKATEARRRARKSGLKAGAVRVVPDRRRKPEKHTPDFLRDPDWT